jgi:hypothetical protein
MWRDREQGHEVRSAPKLSFLTGRPILSGVAPIPAQCPRLTQRPLITPPWTTIWLISNHTCNIDIMNTDLPLPRVFLAVGTVSEFASCLSTYSLVLVPASSVQGFCVSAWPQPNYKPQLCRHRTLLTTCNIGYFRLLPYS